MCCSIFQVIAVATPLLSYSLGPYITFIYLEKPLPYNSLHDIIADVLNIDKSELTVVVK